MDSLSVTVSLVRFSVYLIAECWLNDTAGAENSRFYNTDHNNPDCNW